MAHDYEEAFAQGLAAVTAGETYAMPKEGDTHLIARNGKVILCLTCHTASHNPNDVRERYCAHCKVFHPAR